MSETNGRHGTIGRFTSAIMRRRLRCTFLSMTRLCRSRGRASRCAYLISGRTQSDTSRSNGPPPYARE